MIPFSMAPSYKVPFKKGKVYVAQRKVLGLIDHIEEGVEVIYRDAGHSLYDGIIGFFFDGVDGNKYRWDIYDDLNPEEEYAGRFDLKK